ncbi:hypothetical protein HPB51_015610 [Rhipicephalus microplus]|uniref:Uncharacterized protein n=1 Tax=Rhipicephalus microplus TaxID=6941 RepID=A0A9J6DHS4_RHIMP|nr:hypothetical protein HPB51_015610 [Rhipicephalus microplus]
MHLYGFRVALVDDHRRQLSLIDVHIDVSDDTLAGVVRSGRVGRNVILSRAKADESQCRVGARVEGRWRRDHNDILSYVRADDILQCFFRGQFCCRLQGLG